MLNIIAVYKPKGPTSHDIIDQIRKITGQRKVGHAGTLDPLASGVLVVGIGREATRMLSAEVKKEKEYVATIKFGETSETDDEEGKKIKQQNSEIMAIDIDKMKKIVNNFVGVISQTPPAYSALKIHGQPSYKLARQGKEVKLNPRKVNVKNIEIIKYEWPFLKIKVVCGPGVYIRSLARDIGSKLGVGGYLYELERTRVGDFTKEMAVNIDALPGASIE